MKITHTHLQHIFVTFFGCTLVIAGCSQEARKEAADTYEEAADTTRAIGKDTQDWFTNTWQSVADHTSNQRKAFTEKLKTASETVETRASDFYESGDDITEKAIARYEKALDAFQMQLAAASEASDEAWKESKVKVEQAWHELKAATENLTHSKTPDGNS